MTNDNDPTLEDLTQILADLIDDRGITAAISTGGIAIAGLDLAVSVTSIWHNPHKSAAGEQRTFGIQIAATSRTMFDDVTVFEYSYGLGTSDMEAARAALERWIDLDLVVLIEAASQKLERCASVQIASDGKRDICAGTWTIYLGPLNFVAGTAGAQNCCQACFFTMAMPALMPLLSTPESFAVKIVAAKSDNGETSADCRRNGHDLPEAIRQIAEAARGWPSLPGTQMRRQYLYFKAPEDMDTASAPTD